MRSPDLDLRDLSEPERITAFHIQGQLYDLDSYITAFERALLLFVQCNQETDRILKEIANTRPVVGAPIMEWRESMDALFDRLKLLGGWKFMAARDASMSVYHFRATLFAIAHNLRNTEKLKALVNISELIAATDEFEKNFPNICDLRHAIGHHADNIFAPEQMEKHSLKPNNLMLSSQLDENLFSYSHNKSIVSLRISSETLASLRETQQKFYDSFTRLD